MDKPKMTREEALEAAAKILAQLAEHGIWYPSAIELRGGGARIDGEELFAEVERILDVIEGKLDDNPQ